MTAAAPYILVLDLFALAIVGTIFLNSFSVRFKGFRDRLFFWILSLNGGILLLELVSCLLPNEPLRWVQVTQFVLLSLAFALLALSCWLWLIYTEQWIHTGKHKFMLVSHPLYGLPFLVEVLLLILNIPYGFLFDISAKNRLVLGPFYAAHLLLFIIYLVIAALMAFISFFRKTNPQQRKSSILLALFLVIPALAFLLHQLLPHHFLAGAPMALSLFVVYLSLQRRWQDEEHLRQLQREQALTESRMAIMLSQIQPHFLYNALSVIVYFCDEDPQEAKRATLAFSDYLRGNLTSLKQTAPVPFAEELRHIKNYLFLEKYRFEDRLNVQYHIETEAFTLPPMTVQPLVENAVRHGLCHVKGGGTVTISTREQSDCFEVIVGDDGVGFLVPPAASDAAQGGIANVRHRLAVISNGTLRLQSVPGAGATATITIPKGANKDADSGR